jgi:VWFA-related protein
MHQEKLMASQKLHRLISILVLGSIAPLQAQTNPLHDQAAPSPLQLPGSPSDPSTPAQAGNPNASEPAKTLDLRKDPPLTLRPPPKPAAARGAVEPGGKIQLDMVLSDSDGNAVTGLQPWDFKLLDQNQPRRILTFHAYDGVAVKPDLPVEIILVLDALNLPFQQVSAVRQELDRFLRANGGQLKQPLSLMLLTDKGLKVQPQPSLKGNAVAAVLAKITGSVSSINPAMGAEGQLERFQRSVRQMAVIAENEAAKPGRKLLIWVGPGWPILDRGTVTYSAKDPVRMFDTIVELSTRLREARIAVYSVAPADASLSVGKFTNLYQAFLAGVTAPKLADSGNLALKVLATQTGGQILGPGNDLAEQIDRCIADANVFYRISFDPPPAAHADEYRDLRVQVDKPGLTVRTYSGYYNDPPDHGEANH